MLPVAEALQCFLSMMADLQLLLKMGLDKDIVLHFEDIQIRPKSSGTVPAANEQSAGKVMHVQ